MSLLDILKRVQIAAEADTASHGQNAETHARLLDEIHNLQLAAETPPEKIRRVCYQIMQNVSLRAAVELGIVQAIAAGKGQTVTAVELAGQTGSDQLLIVRLMRLVAYAGIVDDKGSASYAANETTEFLTTSFMGGHVHLTDFAMKISSNIVSLIRSQNGRLHMFPSGPSQTSPFHYTYGMSMFDYLKTDPEQKQAFDELMSLRKLSTAPRWYNSYFDDEIQVSALKTDPDAVLLVDVAGGRGHDISRFKQDCSQLPGRLVLQDLPETLRAIDPKLEHVEVMEYDFFNPQPIKGARFYHFRAIMHDWPDDECASILSATMSAMDPEYSRIVIEDWVLPDENVNLRAASMDILMMLYLSGIERTESHWRSLLTDVGLEIVSIRPVGLESVIEARIAKR
ncbi:Hypothetical protein R9X50_00437100 [Acrodontium crateriforme]|uniref:O-methyltransferase n=1 Tax=Acrodontium crateriforme TaxID=150365 RepID=A0AAQ3M585_9PEZI|nr:Hypothetical protein R9X50_00437100 [Acrodontium crateriforme]